MLLRPIKEMENKNPFIRNLMTQVRKKVKFSLDLVSFKKAQKEIQLLEDELNKYEKKGLSS